MLHYHYSCTHDNNNNQGTDDNHCSSHDHNCSSHDHNNNNHCTLCDFRLVELDSVDRDLRWPRLPRSCAHL